ncbi:MAG: hypothetical protein KJZ75_11365 [Hyphomonadaceae bacterium]|nr:hypothetical protein [Hyphomonadaceae bacterium]
MHAAEPRGYLLIAGRVPTYAELAKILGDSEEEVAAYIKELGRNGVYSRTDGGHYLGPGVIFCRRMVREAAKDAQDAENGALGGNPRLAAVVDANAATAFRAEEKRIAARERARRYRERKKADSVTRVTPKRHAENVTRHVTVTVDKRDCGEKNAGATSASASVTGVNPHLPISNSNSSSSSEPTAPEPAPAPTEPARPPSPSIGGGRAPRRRATSRKPIPDEDPTARKAAHEAFLREQREKLGVADEAVA